MLGGQIISTEETISEYLSQFKKADSAEVSVAKHIFDRTKALSPRCSQKPECINLMVHCLTFANSYHLLACPLTISEFLANCLQILYLLLKSNT